MLSRDLQYALRLLVGLLEAEPGPRLGLGELALRSGVPRPFAGKIGTSLARAGLLASRRGRGGGVRLADGACERIVGEVAAALGSRVDHGCILGRACAPGRCCGVPGCAGMAAALRGLLGARIGELSRRAPVTSDHDGLESAVLDDELL